MKKFYILLSAGAIALLLAGCSSNTGYTLKGTVDDIEGPVYIMDEYEAVVDSAEVKNGSFTFKEEYTGPGLYTLRDNLGGIPSFVARFFPEKGALTVVGDSLSRNKTISGAPINDAFNEMNQRLRDILDEYNDPNTAPSRKEALDKEYDDVPAEYFDQNHDNYFGVYLLRQQAYYYSGQDLLDELDSFPEDLQETKMVTDLRTTAEQRVKTDVGEHYIDVEQNDPDGKPITLSSVVEKPANKYVLLDFWASWCGPCMNEVPYLVETYKEFHKKGFEIYGVSFDTNADNWVNAIKENELKWVHVSDVNRFDNQAARDYTIQAIPSNVLIDCADGTIIAKNLRGEDVHSKIAELLGE